MLRRIEHDITIDIPFWAQARLLAGRSDACGLDPPRTQGLGLLRTNQGGHAMSTSTLYAATAKFGQNSQGGLFRRQRHDGERSHEWRRLVLSRISRVVLERGRPRP